MCYIMLPNIVTGPLHWWRRVINSEVGSSANLDQTSQWLLDVNFVSLEIKLLGYI